MFGGMLCDHGWEEAIKLHKTMCICIYSNWSSY